MIRVDDILQFDIMKGARLVAGHRNSQNVIQSVNVMDAPDIVTWVKKNELLLTTGYPISTNRAYVEELISGLRDKGCSALGIKVKRYFESVPQAIIESADRHGLPVIELPYDVTFGQIISEIMERNITTSEQTSSIKDLIEEGLEEQKLDHVIQLLSQILDRSVSLESLYIESSIAFRSGKPDEPLLAHLRAIDLKPLPIDSLERSELYLKKSFKMDAEENDLGLRNRTIVPVRFRTEVIGKISIWYHLNEKPIDEWNQAIDYGLSLIVFLLKEQRSQTISAKKVKARIIQDLLPFDRTELERVEKLADFAGIILRGPFQVVTLSDPNRENTPAEADQNDLNMIVFRLDRHLHRYLRQEPLIGLHEGRIILVLYHLVDHKSELVDHLVDLVNRNDSLTALVHDFTIGISEVCNSLEQINKAYHETLIAIAFAREKRRRVMRYTQLGLVGPFLKPEKGMGLHDLIDSTIRPILDQGDDAGKLLSSLQAYFRNNENLVETARELFLHRNSLKYRLDMIEKLTGLSLDRTEDKFKLYLGVKAYEVLRFGSED